MIAIRSANVAVRLKCTLTEGVIDMEKQTVNILGTEYTIETHKISEDETMKNNQWSGYCDEEQKQNDVADMKEKQYVGIS